MIRPFTCICMLLAAGSGLYLYQTKHRAQMLDREIGRTLKQIDQARDRIGALKGEWALLSEPERLNELAGQHLALKTLAPTQFVAMADLATRLPAPLPPGSMLPPMDEPAPSQPIAAAKPILAAPRLAERTPERAPERPAEKPVQMAALPQQAAPSAGLPQPAIPPAAVPPAPRPAAKPQPTVVALNSPALPSPAGSAPAPHALPPPAPPMPMAPRIMAPVMNVSAGQIPQPAHAPAHAPAPGPTPGSVGESVARTARLREQSSPVVPVASPGTVYPPPTNAAPYGSALGGAGRVALPAPVPFGAGAR